MSNMLYIDDDDDNDPSCDMMMHDQYISDNTYIQDIPKLKLKEYKKHHQYLMKDVFNEFKDINDSKSVDDFDEIAVRPINSRKNRYDDVLPLKHTAVKLSKINDDEDSEYINANYVQDEGNSQLYICAQAPLPTTFSDWWRMIWETDVPLIVMLTNLVERDRRKADKYWPSMIGRTIKFGNICVKYKKKQVRSSSICMRTFLLWTEETDDFDSGTEYPYDDGFDEVYTTSSDSDELDTVNSYDFSSDKDDSSDDQEYLPTDMDEPLNTEVRTVIQIHCQEWPDSGVPDSTTVMKNLVNEVEIRKKSKRLPILVHCSAGIGRTGTFVAIHSTLQKLLKGKEFDIKETVLKLRSQRIGMVQSREQYAFIHTVVSEVVDERKMLKHFESLEEPNRNSYQTKDKKIYKERYKRSSYNNLLEIIDFDLDI